MRNAQTPRKHDFVTFVLYIASWGFQWHKTFRIFFSLAPLGFEMFGNTFKRGWLQPKFDTMYVRNTRINGKCSWELRRFIFAEDGE